MYARTDSDGQTLSAAYAALRNRYEPVSEILQIKGASETHPILSSQDEFAGFELGMAGEDVDLESARASYARSGLDRP